MITIDINCDVGESFGAYTIGNDAEIMKYISSANVACGYHASDPLVIQKTIEAALNQNVAIGAHPGFHDLEGFGRRNMHLTHEQLYASILYQVSALKSMTEALGGKLNHVKPHGAMYNMAATDYEMALIIAKAVKAIDPALKLYGLTHSFLIKAASDCGLEAVSEAFVDRRYNQQGQLTPRSQADAVISDLDESVNQALQIASVKQVKCNSGQIINIEAQTLCIHGDGDHALPLAKKLNDAFKQNNITRKQIL